MLMFVKAHFVRRVRLPQSFGWATHSQTSCLDINGGCCTPMSQVHMAHPISHGKPTMRAFDAQSYREIGSSKRQIGRWNVCKRSDMDSEPIRILTSRDIAEKSPTTTSLASTCFQLRRMLGRRGNNWHAIPPEMSRR